MHYEFLTSYNTLSEYIIKDPNASLSLLKRLTTNKYTNRSSVLCFRTLQFMKYQATPVVTLMGCKLAIRRHFRIKGRNSQYQNVSVFLSLTQPTKSLDL